MASYLYRLARASFRHRRWVIVGWLLLLVLLGWGAAMLRTLQSNSFTIPGVEAQQASNLLKQRFPAVSPGGAQGLVVFEAATGSSLNDPGPKAAIESSVAALGKLIGVNSVADPYATGKIAPNGALALSTVIYQAQPSEITGAQRAALMAAPAPARAAGLSVVIGGTAATVTSSTGSTKGVGVLSGAVVLAITFGSLVAAGLPLLTAIIGVGLSGLLAVSHWVQLSSTAPILALMLGLAAAATVATAVPIALTLLPALLGVAGRRVIGTRIPGVRRRPDYDDSAADAKVSAGERWARFVTSHRTPVLVGAVAVLAVIAVPLLSMHTTLPDNSTAKPGSGTRVAYDLITKDFGGGYNGPLTVVVTGPTGHTGPAADATRLRTITDIRSVGAPRINPAQDTAVISAIPASAPTAPNTTTLVRDIRALAPSLGKPTTSTFTFREPPRSTSTSPTSSAQRCRSTSPSSSDWRSSCCCWCSARSWCLSKLPSGSCSPSAPRSAPSSRSSSGAGWRTCLACPRLLR